MQNIKIKLTKKQKKRILNTATFLIIVFILFISFNQTPRDWLRGQFNLPLTNQSQTEAKPDMVVWKLTYRPKVAPLGTLLPEETIVTDLKNNNYQDVMDIAIEAVSQDTEVRQIAFEVDLDDNSSLLSPEEKATLDSIEYLTLFTESGNKLAQARFQQSENQILAIFNKPGIQLGKGEIASLMLKIKPLSGVQQNKKLRLQLILTKTFATQSDGSEALIFAELGKNNNGNLDDDFVASNIIELR